MAATNDTPHRHAKKTSHGPRKRKPKFEVPVEAAAPDTTNGWVYRADEVPEPSPRVETATAVADEVVAEEMMNPFLVVGMGMVFVGLGAFGLVSLTAAGMMVAPFRLARNLLPGA